MILEHNYYWFKSALSPETCNRIIDAGLVKMEQFEKEFGKKSTDATTFDHKQKGGTIGDQPAGNLSADTLTLQGRKKKGIKEEEVYIRDTKVSWLEDQWIYDLIHPFIHEANRAAGWNFEWDWSESCQFAKYGINNFYGWHTDSGYQTYEKFDPEVHEMIRHPDGTPMLDAFNMVIPKNRHMTSDPNKFGKLRKISVTVNLTDPKNYDGGNLKFDFGPHSPHRYHTCTEIRPKGSIIVFPSHINHQVTPITRGERYSLVLWNLGKPFK